MDNKSIIKKLKEYSQLDAGTVLTTAMKLILLNMAKHLDEQVPSEVQPVVSQPGEDGGGRHKIMDGGVKIFVSYSYVGRIDEQYFTGFGNCVLKRYSLPKDEEQLEDLQNATNFKAKKDNGMDSVTSTILHWKELGGE